MAETNPIMTFWEIICENQIEIPVIQRDYAQGRITDRINQIRRDIVKSIAATLQPTRVEPLHLDFVYGRIQGRDQAKLLAKNKEAIKNVLLAVKGYADNLNVNIVYELFEGHKETELASQKLIPLDGQQRLTTLFLLHWYLLQRATLPQKVAFLRALKGFRYKTRKSTTEFCSFLTTPERLPDDLFAPGKIPSKQLMKATNFLKLWNNDPSVKGMLVMIDALHDALKEHEKPAYAIMWEKLTTGKMITFDFLDLDELDQTDELYVKMNARGKALTDFEHFKAWLQEHVKKAKITVTHMKWEDKLDAEWLDLFWTNRPANSYKVDDAIYRFVKNINLFIYIAQTPEEKIDKKLIEKARDTNTDTNFIAPASFGNLNFFSARSLDFLFTTLNTLAFKDLAPFDPGLENIYCPPFTPRSKSRISQFFLNANNNPSLPDTVFYYAYLLFVNDPAATGDTETVAKFSAWMRICRNLVYNTYIQNPDNLIKAVKAMTEIAEYKFDIEKAILVGNLKINFFDSQAKEEKRKLGHFNQDGWKEKILAYENHEYFYGQINFLFEILPDQNNFELFTRYGDRLSELFRKDIKLGDHLLQRALLCKGDYPIHLSGSKYTFCKPDMGRFRARNDNWRKVFDDQERLDLLKLLLEDPRSTTTIAENDSTDDWRNFFIQYPETIAYCDNCCFDFADDRGLDIKLLKGTTYNGKHTDLYLYVLKLKLKGFSVLKFNHADINNYRTRTSYPKIEVSGRGDFYLTLNYSNDLDAKTDGFEVRYELQKHTTLIESAFHDFGSFKAGLKFKSVPNIAAMEATIDDIVARLKHIDDQLKN
jgi:hypothetical protein